MQEPNTWNAVDKTTAVVAGEDQSRISQSRKMQAFQRKEGGKFNIYIKFFGMSEVYKVPCMISKHFASFPWLQKRTYRPFNWTQLKSSAWQLKQ